MEIIKFCNEFFEFCCILLGEKKQVVFCWEKKPLINKSSIYQQIPHAIDTVLIAKNVFICI